MALSTRQESVRAELAEAGEQLMAARVDRDRHALRLQQLAPNHSQQAFPPAAPPAAAAGPPGAAKEVSAGDGYRSYWGYFYHQRREKVPTKLRPPPAMVAPALAALTPPHMPASCGHKIEERSTLTLHCLVWS